MWECRMSSDAPALPARRSSWVLCVDRDRCGASREKPEGADRADPQRNQLQSRPGVSEITDTALQWVSI